MTTDGRKQGDAAILTVILRFLAVSGRVNHLIAQYVEPQFCQPNTS